MTEGVVVVVDRDGALAVGIVAGMMWRRKEVVVDRGGAVVRLPSSS
jgi:hypothetical protein